MRDEMSETGVKLCPHSHLICQNIWPPQDVWDSDLQQVQIGGYRRNSPSFTESNWTGEARSES